MKNPSKVHSPEKDLPLSVVLNYYKEAAPKFLIATVLTFGSIAVGSSLSEQNKPQDEQEMPTVITLEQFEICPELTDPLSTVIEGNC